MVPGADVRELGLGNVLVHVGYRGAFIHVILLRHRHSQQLAPDLVEVVLDGRGEHCEALDHPPALVREHRDVEALRVASQTQAACDELVDVDDAGSVCVQQLKEAPGLVDVQVHGGKVGGQALVMYATLELIDGDAAAAVLVQVSEDLPQLKDQLGLVLQVAGDHLIPLLLRACDGRLAEHAGHDVEDGEGGERHVQDEEEHPDPVHELQGLEDFLPRHASGDGLEQRED
mmetsp:Transcript_132547/g.412113  ORF Transcript_132547/g.412113 Transcript_132547/m.412113 type:complete len:230 (-) Transcript_132547:1345-2034(-)